MKHLSISGFIHVNLWFLSKDQSKAVVLALPGAALLLGCGGGGSPPSMTPAVIATVPVGAGPTGVAVDTAAGKVYVVNGGANSVSVLDHTTGNLLGTLAAGSSPFGAGVDSGLGRVYVSDSADNDLRV